MVSRHGIHCAMRLYIKNTHTHTPGRAGSEQQAVNKGSGNKHNGGSNGQQDIRGKDKVKDG